MSASTDKRIDRHDLRPGEKVVVASRAEILASLDEDGTLNGMPVMPPMLDLCGTEQVVYKRADKSCDTIDGTGGRRLHDTVHLVGSRCDGKAYGGCQAGCLIFWNEKWLSRGGEVGDSSLGPEDLEARVEKGVYHASSTDDRIVYRCQATELVRASEPLSKSDIRQYWRDWRTNGVGLFSFVRSFSFWMFRQSLKVGAYSLQVKLFNRWQKLWGRPPFPLVNGTLEGKTPEDVLDLKPDELVRVKSYEEILATLDKNNRNRGMFFDAEMVKYCGHTFRVEQRVTQIIHEKTGEMINFGSPGIILKNVFCRSQVSVGRLFCPRSIHHYWREIWLERED